MNSTNRAILLIAFVLWSNVLASKTFFIKGQSIYNITNTIDLQGEEIILPNNITLYFWGGEIRNGRMVFNNTKLLGSIKLQNIKCYGVINNEEIHLKWFSGRISQVSQLSKSGHIFIFDHNDIIQDDVINLSGCKDVLFDGVGNVVKANEESSYFFYYEGSCNNIEIRNICFVGNKNSIFFGGKSTSDLKKDIQVHDNTILTCKLGISFNDDIEGDHFINSSISSNKIKMNNLSSEIGTYGIHLSGASYCTIADNSIFGANRHAIYHAWGHDNVISRNYLVGNKVNITEETVLSHGTMQVLRKSQNLVISSNFFINNGGVSLVIMHQSDTEHARDAGNTCNIKVENNYFCVNVHCNFTNFLTIGRAYKELPRYYTKSIVIKNNFFFIDNQQFESVFKLYHVEDVELSNNSINVKHHSIAKNDSYIFQYSVSDWTLFKDISIHDNEVFLNTDSKVYYHWFNSIPKKLVKSIMVRNNKLRKSSDNSELSSIDDLSLFPNIQL